MATKKGNPIAKIHVLKSQLVMSNEDYRAMLIGITGKNSAKLLNKQEQLRVISHLQASVDNKPNLSSAEKNTLLDKIATLLSNAGLHKNYGEAIADRMHKKKMKDCSAPELLQLLDALR